MTICRDCKQKLVFDVVVKGTDGKFLPLNAEDKKPHQCRSGDKPQQGKISNFTLFPELMQIHEQAVEMCKEAYGGIYDNATEDRKMMYILHWENLICQLKCVKKGEGKT